MASVNSRQVLAIVCILAGVGLSGCMTTSGSRPFVHLSERECLARVMYFESNRSSEDGMLAVGTVVMNRRDSGKYPRSVCGVVGQRGQFADGALYKRMSGSSKDRAFRVADQVLAGQRHSQVGDAMFFHTYGYHYPYRNMHYVAVAGGNAFYEKKKPGTFRPNYPRPTPILVAAAPVYRPAPTPIYRPAAARVVMVSSTTIDDADRQRLSMFLSTGEGLN